jgi:hypothetical protein
MTPLTTRLVIATLIVFTSGAVAGYQAGRQTTPPQSLPGAIVFPAGTVLSGQRLGFKVTGNVKGVNRGRLVVEADGQWIDVQLVQ